MFPSRKQFRVGVAPSDRQLWAIGMVTVQWSNFEMLLQNGVEALLADDKTALEEFQKTRSLQIRLDLLQQLVEDKLAEPHRTRFKAMVVEARNAQFLRDRIVHGSWSSKDGAILESPEAHSAFNWLKPRQPFEWKLDFGTIKSVALRIEALSFEWQNSLLDEIRPGEEGILFSVALQRKLRKPGPP